MNCKTDEFSIHTWLDLAKKQLLAEKPDEAISSLYALLSFELQKPVDYLLAYPEHIIPPELLIDLQIKLAKLIQKTPLAYILNKWYFFNLEFIIDQNVLIPRPETELLVERAIKWLKENPHKNVVADVGTGCGCIAIAIAHHFPDVIILATDISIRALRIAKSNISKYNSYQSITLMNGNLLDAISQRFDLICANLPYIPTNRLLKLSLAQNEPVTALDGGKNGFQIISYLIADLPRVLAKGGKALLEIESSQTNRALDYCKKHIPNALINIEKDLAGNDRLLDLTLP